MGKMFFTIITLAILVCCQADTKQTRQLNFTKPSVAGNLITFVEEKAASYFKTEAISTTDLKVDFSAPARVVATVINSSENPEQHIILFDNPALTSNYTQLVQRSANIRQIQDVLIKQRMIELERVQDLQKHGAATGRDVLEAQTLLAVEKTNLINEKAGMLEHETMLKLGGFSASALQKAEANTIWVISEIPDNQISKVKTGGSCQVRFSSFPNDVFKGRIEDIGDVVDNVTRMLKLRIGIVNQDHRLKAGMFGVTQFGVSEGKFITVPLEAVVTVQGKNYVFVRKSALEFERRAISTGQQSNNKIIVFDGLKEQEEVVIKGTMQLKGLSFGY